MRTIGMPARTPPTRPRLALNSAITLVLNSLGICGRPRNSVGDVEAAIGGGLVVDQLQLQRLSLSDPVKQRRAGSDGDRVHDEAKLVEQRLVDEAPQQAGSTDDVDGVARLGLECAQLVDV